MQEKKAAGETKLIRAQQWRLYRLTLVFWEPMKEMEIIRRDLKGWYFVLVLLIWSKANCSDTSGAGIPYCHRGSQFLGGGVCLYLNTGCFVDKTSKKKKKSILHSLLSNTSLDQKTPHKNVSCDKLFLQSQTQLESTWRSQNSSPQRVHIKLRIQLLCHETGSFAPCLFWKENKLKKDCRGFQLLYGQGSVQSLWHSKLALITA